MPVRPNVFVALGEPARRALEKYVRLFPKEHAFTNEWFLTHRFLVVDDSLRTPLEKGRIDYPVEYWIERSLWLGDDLTESEAIRRIARHVTELDADIRKQATELAKLKTVVTSALAEGFSMKTRHIILADLDNPLVRRMIVPFLQGLLGSSIYSELRPSLRLALITSTSLERREKLYPRTSSVPPREAGRIPEQDAVLAELQGIIRGAEDVILNAWVFNERDNPFYGGKTDVPLKNGEAAEDFLESLLIASTLGEHQWDGATAFTDPDPHGTEFKAKIETLGFQVIMAPVAEIRECRLGFALSGAVDESGAIARVLGAGSVGADDSSKALATVEKVAKAHGDPMGIPWEFRPPRIEDLFSGIGAAAWLNSATQALNAYEGDLSSKLDDHNRRCAEEHETQVGSEGQAIREVDMNLVEKLTGGGLNKDVSYLELMRDAIAREQKNHSPEEEWSEPSVPSKNFQGLIDRLEEALAKRPRLSTYLVWACTQSALGITATVMLSLLVSPWPIVTSVTGVAAIVALEAFLYWRADRLFKSEIAEVARAFHHQVGQQAESLRSHFSALARRVTSLWARKSLSALGFHVASALDRLQTIRRGLEEELERWRRYRAAREKEGQRKAFELKRHWLTIVRDLRGEREIEGKVVGWLHDVNDSHLVELMGADRTVKSSRDVGCLPYEVVDTFIESCDGEVSKRTADVQFSLLRAVDERCEDGSLVRETLRRRKPCFAMYMEPNVGFTPGDVVHLFPDPDGQFKDLLKEFTTSQPGHPAKLLKENMIVLLQRASLPSDALERA